jgi:hypothetical protein
MNRNRHQVSNRVPLPPCLVPVKPSNPFRLSERANPGVPGREIIVFAAFAFSAEFLETRQSNHQPKSATTLNRRSRSSNYGSKKTLGRRLQGPPEESQRGVQGRPRQSSRRNMATKRYGKSIGGNLAFVLTKYAVIKIKKDLIHKAKVKKQYAKIKAREPPIDKPIPDVSADEPAPAEVSQELHPERQAMLDEPREPTPPPAAIKPPRSQEERDMKRRERDRKRKPGYFEKDLDFANRKKKEAEERQAEFERREKEKREKIEERERFRKAMAKARTGGKNGQRKLGRESKVLLERVQKLVQQ